MFYAVPTARVIFTAKTSLDVSSLSLDQFLIFSVFGDRIDRWDEVPICSSGTQCPYSTAQMGYHVIGPHANPPGHVILTPGLTHEYHASRNHSHFLMSFVWLGPAPTGNRTHKSTWSVLGPPYCRLLWSAGATEGLFITRGLHQEPPPRTPTGFWI